MWFWPGLNRDNAAVSPEPPKGIDVHYYLTALFPSFLPSLLPSPPPSFGWVSIPRTGLLVLRWQVPGGWLRLDCWEIASLLWCQLFASTHPPTHHLDTIGHCYLDEAKRSYYCNNLTFSNLDLPEFCSPGVFYKLVITDRKTGFWSPVWLVVF